jgi:hypothetical protein
MSCPRCTRPEVLAPEAAYRWPAGETVTVCLREDTVPAGVAVADVEAEIAYAQSAWSSACAVAFGRVDRPEDARVVIDFEKIDGQWNVLGLTDLPVGDPAAHDRMRLDSAERWSPAILRQTILHELGHGIGMEHSGPGIVAVMAPTLDLSLYGRGLQPWDVAFARGLYGPPTPAQAPAPAPWLKPFDFDFAIVDPGVYQLVGQVDTRTGSVVNPVLSRKG